MLESSRPFPESLRMLAQLRDISLREVCRRCERRYNWGSTGTFSGLLGGEFTPTSRAMEHIASVLEVAPEFFAEYRLTKLRESLDPDIVGLPSALRTYADLIGADEGAEPEPLSPKEAGRRGESEGEAESS
jgi:transcriptional regulator with XRE-family HTH domain